ncbi:uncharacterized protein RJT20DRAFT_134613 [Scheffersomyces xylosifermentans]|uniref:uncharacterized protein n=1 Tax=Scheffersomyces xylosifermentans TaxID=1304137 RepID=UPI00315CD076
MRVTSKLLFLCTLSVVISAPTKSNVITGKAISEDTDFFDPIPKKMRKPAMETIHVDSIHQIETEYAHILNSGNNKVVLFYVTKTGTFLAKSQGEGGNRVDSNLPSESLDKRQDDSYWENFSYEDTAVVDFPGFVPVSACQSQEYGHEGSISFSYAMSTTLHMKHTMDSNAGLSSGFPVSIPFITYGVSVGITMSIELTYTQEVSGTTTCNLKSGQIGQILLRPKYASVIPKSRRMKWSSALQKFLTPSDFQLYDRMYVLLEQATYQLDCATNDVVPLFCEGVKLGEPNWEHPLGVGYEDRMQKRLVT